MTRLYLQEQPAVRLYLDTPDTQLLVLKSEDPPELYLEKAKYTRREGSPGNYRYYYDKPTDTGPAQQTLFGGTESVATQQQIIEAVNKIPDHHDMDFGTLAEKLEGIGVHADTKMIGDAFDSDKITGQSKGSEKPIIGAYGGKDIHGPTQDMKDASEQMREGRGENYAHHHGRLEKMANDQVSGSSGNKDYHSNAAWQLRNAAYDTDDKATQETTIVLARAHEEAASKTKKSVHLYLDLGVEKANPNRDPSVGQFIGGGAGKAQSGEGQEDFADQVKDLMDTMPGEDLEKYKRGAK